MQKFKKKKREEQNGKVREENKGIKNCEKE